MPGGILIVRRNIDAEFVGEFVSFVDPCTAGVDLFCTGEIRRKNSTDECRPHVSCADDRYGFI
jgi:hypothetical protein